MILRWLVASLHLIALPIGFGAVVVRGAALRGRLDKSGLDRVFRADTLWGLAAAAAVGPGYSATLTEFVATSWRPAAAAHRCESLARLLWYLSTLS